MWRVILSHLFGALQKECNGQVCHHKMARAYRKPLWEKHDLLPPEPGARWKRMRSKISPAEMVLVKKLRQVLVAEATAEGAWQRGTFLGRRYFFSDK
jgi:hypothetical protein